MVWLLCTEIATIDFLAFLNTSSELIVWEEKLPLVPLSSLHDLEYSNFKKYILKSGIMNKLLIDFQLTAIVVFIRAVDTIIYAIADLFLADALSTALKSIATL